MTASRAMGKTVWPPLFSVTNPGHRAQGKEGKLLGFAKVRLGREGLTDQHPKNTSHSAIHLVTKD